ncbi:hypothetical protein [Methylobacterium segetis]|uniref:hypothetical protein n=1 Tax=Methylobacterium segetis TaxID=2488750 RepID=UPI001043682A|nr:hypothetical protein [Methylobacterium segetis]
MSAALHLGSLATVSQESDAEMASPRPRWSLEKLVASITIENLPGDAWSDGRPMGALEWKKICQSFADCALRDLLHT